MGDVQETMEILRKEVEDAHRLGIARREGTLKLPVEAGAVVRKSIIKSIRDTSDYYGVCCLVTEVRGLLDSTFLVELRGDVRDLLSVMEILTSLFANLEDPGPPPQSQTEGGLLFPVAMVMIVLIAVLLFYVT